MAIVIEFFGTDFSLTPDQLPPQCVTDLKALGAPGDALPGVVAFRSQWGVCGDPDTCRAYLRGYGAWDDDELQDHDTNLQRLIWLTGCQFNEEGEAYFSAY